MIECRAIIVEDPKSIPTLLKYYNQHSPLTSQKLSKEARDKLIEKERLHGHLQGHFRSRPDYETINISHLKRIKNNKEGQISMLLGTAAHCDSLPDHDSSKDSFSVSLPSKMLYQRALFEKFHAQCQWPMAFNTQPPGFELIKSHEVKVPTEMCDHNTGICGESYACLIDLNQKVVMTHFGESGGCVIDHPIMVLAQKLGEKHLQQQGVQHDDYFMKGLSLVTTNEPCFMCAMALVHSRISRVYFMKETEPFSLTKAQLFCIEQLNHQFYAFKLNPEH